MTPSNAVLASILRTLVPWIVATVGPLATQYLNWTPENLSAVATLVIGAVYYVAVRLLEQVSPKFGWLLGAPVQPQYSTPAPD